MSKHEAPILVTGGAGHLGANLVRKLLADGARVRVLLRPTDDNRGVDGIEVERVYGDLRDPAACRRAVAGCERAYHVAAKISTIEGNARHRREIFDCNVVGTKNLLTAAKEAKLRRVVVTGSFSAVGYNVDHPSRPADEGSIVYPFARVMPYEHSKLLAEQECLRAAVDGLDVVIATSCAIVGGHDYLPSRLGRTLCDYANGKLRAYISGGGFEFVAARDIVAGHLLAMEKGRSGQKYIFCSEFLTLDEIIDHFEEVTGLPRPRMRLPAPVMLAFAEVASAYLSRFHPSFPQRFTPGAIRLLRMNRRGDITKAREELGYRPTSILAAVREAYAFHHARGAVKNAAARRPAGDAEPVRAGNGQGRASSHVSASRAH